MFQSNFIKKAGMAFATATALFALGVQAQDLPKGPMKIVIGFPAGGALDTMTRALADEVSAELDKPVIVENKPGASTQIALVTVKRAAPDGNTILITPSTPFVTQPLTYDNLPFDPDKDLVPVAHLADTPLVATTSVSRPYSSMAEYIEWVKQNPKESGVGIVALGGVLHFGLLQLNEKMGVDLMPVGYKGAPPMLTDEIGGVLPIGMDTVASAKELVKAGKLKYLGVPGLERSSLLPDVPTYAEQGVLGFENASSWYAAYVPAGTPADVVKMLEAMMIRIVKAPDFTARMAENGMATTGLPGDVVTQTFTAQREAFRPIVKASGFRAGQ